MATLLPALTITTAGSGTDGSMTASTCQDGILGPQFRVKYVTTGTYGGGTTLTISVIGGKFV